MNKRRKNREGRITEGGGRRERSKEEEKDVEEGGLKNWRLGWVREAE